MRENMNICYSGEGFISTMRENMNDHRGALLTADVSGEGDQIRYATKVVGQPTTRPALPRAAPHPAPRHHLSRTHAVLAAQPRARPVLFSPPPCAPALPPHW